MPAPAQVAGGVAAELLVVVVAQAGLQLLRPEPSLVLGEHAGVVAAVHIVGGAAGDAVAQPVRAGGQLLARLEQEITLQRGLVAAGLQPTDEAGAAEVVRFVAAAPERGLPGHARGRRVAQLAGVHLLHGFGVVGPAAVVVVVALGAQRAAFQGPGIAELAAAAQAGRTVAIAVTVGLVGEAARAPAGRGAVAGVDAVGAQEGEIGAEPAALATQAQPGAGFAQAVAAGADHCPRLQATVFAAGEDLDHAADGIGAVQARMRAAHDLDPLDQLHRQILQRRQAGGGRADPHPVHQHQQLVGSGAAQEQRGLLAQAAHVGQVDAGAAGQQLLQRGGLAALDLGAADDLGRGQAVTQRNLGTGGGDQHFVQFGGRVGSGAGGECGKGQRQGDGGGERTGHHRATPVRAWRRTRRQEGGRVEREEQRTGARNGGDGTPRRPPHRNLGSARPVSGLTIGRVGQGAWLRRRRLPVPCTVAEVAALRSFTVAGAAPALSRVGPEAHRLPVSTRPADAAQVTLQTAHCSRSRARPRPLWAVAWPSGHPVTRKPGA